MSPPSPAFEVEREIGAGATARVFAARLLEPLGDLVAGARVAIKRLRPELAADPVARAAFDLEARAGLAVRHPGLAGTLCTGVDEEGPFQVLPMVPGRTLQAVLEDSGPVPEPLLRTVAAQVASGLAALHAAGWAHGDVKPENMRLDQGGRAALLDLGFARPLEGEDASAPGAALQAGSLAYLAPERARGGPADAQSDVFSLGVTLYECATGVHPFLEAQEAVDSAAARGRSSSGRLLRRSLAVPGGDRLLAALATARFVPPSRLVPQLSPLFDEVLAQLLQRDPERRPSAREVADWFGQGETSAWWRERLDLGASARRGVMGSPQAAHLMPLVGRERELEQLLASWQRALSPDGGTVVWMSGPDGSGKSRLVSDFAARARASERPPLYLYGRCSSLELQRPSAPVLRLLQRWLQLPPDSLPGAREKALLASLVPPATARALALALETDLEQEAATSVPSALARWLVALARTTPLVVFLDDVNFSDEGTHAVLAHLCEELPRLPLLLVIGEREHEPAALPQALAGLRTRLLALPGARELPLAPLDEGAVLQLVTYLFHHSAPRWRIARVLWSRSRGNPGLLGEILRDLLERGQAHPLSATEPDLVLSVPPEKLPLPRSLRTLIQERFDKLTARERRWLQRLAVAGGRINVDFLLRAFPRTSALELDAVLGRLVTLGWLVPAGDRYRFARPALREAVYKAIPEARRVHLHVQAARALRPGGVEGGAPGRMTLDEAFQRAFHLRAAGSHTELLRVLQPLIDALLRRGQPGRVHTLAQWGLEALDALTPTRAHGRQRIRFLEAAADAADRLGERDVQRLWLDRLSDLDLSPERDRRELVRVYLLHGRFAANTGQYGLARGMLRNAVELAEREGDAETESEALRRLAAVQTQVGQLDEAQALVDRARERAAHPPQEALAWLQQALIQILRDELEPALRSVDRAMRLLRRASGWRLPGVFAGAHMLRGRIYRLAGRPRRARGSLQHAVRLAQQASERRLEMEATARLGGLLVDVDRPVEAEARLREALLIAGEIEDLRGRALASLWLGILLWEQGQGEGERLVSSAGRLAGELGLARLEALALAIRARFAHEGDRVEQEREFSARALELLAVHGAELADRIVITGTRALVLHAAGLEDEAEELVRELRRRLRRLNEQIENPVMRRRHRVASTRLLEAVLSADGRIYPRVPLDEVAT